MKYEINILILLLSFLAVCLLMCFLYISEYENQTFDYIEENIRTFW